MPLYEYRCDACGRKFELIQRFSDPPAETCAVCGSGPVQKLMSSPAFQFKGSGWYVTDYARKDQKSPEAKSGQGEGAGGKDSSKDSVQNKAEGGEKSSAAEKSGRSEKASGSEKRASPPASAPTKE